LSIFNSSTGKGTVADHPSRTKRNSPPVKNLGMQ